MFKQGGNNTDFVSFLEDYKRYRVEIFNVNELFFGLSNDVSHFVVAQNIIISSCLSKVLTINFLKGAKRYWIQYFRVG